MFPMSTEDAHTWGRATESCSPPRHLHDCPGPSTGRDGVDFHVQNRLWGRAVGVLSPWLTYAVESEAVGQAPPATQQAQRDAGWPKCHEHLLGQRVECE